MSNVPLEKHGSFFSWGVVLLAIALIMCVFAYASLSKNPHVFQAMIAILILLDVALLFWNRKTLSKADVGFDLAYLVVLLSLVWGAFSGTSTISVRTTPAMLIATIFYRPKLLENGSRRLAFSLSLIIVVAVLPVALGLVRDEGAINALSALYVALVALLWVFCSKFFSKFIKNQT